MPRNDTKSYVNGGTRRLSVTCEVTPHHLLLTDERVSSYDTQTKMKPPLTTEEDRQALLEGLRDGAVDVGFVGRSKAPGHFWAADRILGFLESVVQ